MLYNFRIYICLLFFSIIFLLIKNSKNINYWGIYLNMFFNFIIFNKFYLLIQLLFIYEEIA